MTRDDWIYAAGLMDGEGTIALSKAKANEFRSPSLTLPSTTRCLVDWMAVTFGGAVSTHKAYKAKHSKSWVWQVKSDRALEILALLYPFMREPKKRYRAQLLLTQYKAVTKRNGRYSAIELAVKKQFEAAFFQDAA